MTLIFFSVQDSEGTGRGNPHEVGGDAIVRHPLPCAPVDDDNLDRRAVLSSAVMVPSHAIHKRFSYNDPRKESCREPAVDCDCTACDRTLGSAPGRRCISPGVRSGVHPAFRPAQYPEILGRTRNLGPRPVPIRPRDIAGSDLHRVRRPEMAGSESHSAGTAGVRSGCRSTRARH